MVTARVDLAGLWDSLALLVVTTKPLLSAAALTWIERLLNSQNSMLLQFVWVKKIKSNFH